jgi:hypothetical protein
VARGRPQVERRVVSAIQQERRLTKSETPEAPTKKLSTNDTSDASRRRDRIKLLLTSMTEQTSKVVAILEEAEANEDHLTLGYKSWTAYIAGEYAGLLSDLKLAQRREVVGSLTAIGMSTRAIAGVVGTSHKTVVKDLQGQVVPEVPPDLVDHQDGVDRHVTGMDGKSYTVPSRPVVKPRKPHRGLLPNSYWNAVYDLDKAVRRLEKLHADDRFMANRKTLSDLHWEKLCDIGAVVNSMESDLTRSTGNTCQDCGERMLPSRDFEPNCKTCRDESQ